MHTPQHPFQEQEHPRGWSRALLLAVSLLAAPAWGLAAGTGDPPRPAQAAAAKKTGAQAKPVARKADAPTKASAKKESPTKEGARQAARKPSAGTASAKAGGKKGSAPTAPGALADFGKVAAPDDVVHVANWASYTRNHGKRAFVVIDKKQAQLYVFDPRGKLRSRAPILLGKAIGDHTVPGVGDKPLSQVKEDEKTTPAGRFLAQPGRNLSGEDIIWIDYKAAVSMHRLRKVSAEERRAERMSTPDASDNRISYGCVNVPAKFYDGILKPTVKKHGAFVYVLPETKTAQQQFGSFDVPAAAKDKAA